MPPLPTGRVDLKSFTTAESGDPGGTPDQKLSAARAANTTIVADDRTVVADGNDGHRRWLLNATPVSAMAGTPKPHVVVDGSLAIVTWPSADDPWPGRVAVRAVDIASGRTLWRNDTAAFVTVVRGRVYLSRCRPVQDGRVGDCTVSAVDDRTGAVRWSTPEYAAAQVETADDPQDVDPVSIAVAAPDPVLVTSHPRSGADDRSTAHAASTGAVLRASSGPAARTPVVTEGADPTIDGGCRQTLSATDAATGRRLWTRSLVTAKAPIGSGGRPSCRDLDVRSVTATLASADGTGVPMLLDTATGRTVRQLALRGSVLGVSDGLVVVRTGDVLRPTGLAVAEIATGRIRWTGATSAFDSGIRIVGARVLISDEDDVENDSTLVLALATGTRIGRAPGRLVGAGTGWFATQAVNTQVGVFRLS